MIDKKSNIFTLPSSKPKAPKRGHSMTVDDEEWNWGCDKWGVRNPASRLAALLRRAINLQKEEDAKEAKEEEAKKPKRPFDIGTVKPASWSTPCCSLDCKKSIEPGDIMVFRKGRNRESQNWHRECWHRSEFYRKKSDDI